jgi:hypothetical protein
LFETEGRATTATFATSVFTFTQAWETDPVERNGRPLAVKDRAVRVDLKPFGLVTIRLR